MRISLSGEMKTSNRKIFDAARSWFLVEILFLIPTSRTSHICSFIPTGRHPAERTNSDDAPPTIRERLARGAATRRACEHICVFFVIKFCSSILRRHPFFSRLPPNPFTPLTEARRLRRRTQGLEPRPPAVRPTARTVARPTFRLSSDRLVSSVTNRPNECD